MKKYSLEWTDADAEFVEALLLATGGASGSPLQEILVMNDALSGKVFSLKELEQILEKLTSIDYLEVHKKKLLPGKTLITEYNTAVKAVPDITDAERIQELLRCHELTESKIDEVKDQLREYNLRKYYQQYQEQFG